MKKIIHKAKDRINHDLGWLKIQASFRKDAPTSDRNRFGALVILDDAVMIPGGRGFKLHPHDNMEIISWILSGTDEHNDGVNGIALLRDGDVQLMSAGTGIEHAENNHSATEPVHMFQIWIEPKKKNIEPNYQVKSIKNADHLNKLFTFISPDGANNSLTINQQAYLSVVSLEQGNGINYLPYLQTNGVYVFVLSGHVTIGNAALQDRDALAVYPTDLISIEAVRLSEVLLIEIPMESR
jgi:redox-sensitive bicupin YhaK (pirin superfamily)